MFPQFNIHSTPLLFLVLQGLIFAFLLLNRYQKEGKVADLIMGTILIVMAYHRITYTIGFMGWYDTFKNTKINYYLQPFYLGMGPMIYLYIRTTLKAPFKWKKTDNFHFIPIALFMLYRLIVLIHDAQQEGWERGYEGEWHRDFHIVYFSPIQQLLTYSSQLLYLAFTVQLYVQYRKKVQSFFSNTYQVELNWMLIFLSVYSFLFIYSNVTSVVDAFITDLDYKHIWWEHFFSAIAIVYLGIKAYYTDLSRLHTLTFEMENEHHLPEEKIQKTFEQEKNKITQYLENNQAYLDPDFTLKTLSQSVKMGVNETSEVINAGFGVNFNELINQYRVEEVKKKLQDPLLNHLSLVAIAYDCGFRSKATFNRVFKQMTGISPSSFKQQHGVESP